MIPLRDANPTRRAPIVTIGLIVACFVVFAYEVGSLAYGGGALDAFVRAWGVVPAELTSAWAAGSFASTQVHIAGCHVHTLAIFQGERGLLVDTVVIEPTIEQRAAILGSCHTTVDAKQEFAEEYCTTAIAMNADYFGYPLSTSIARPLIAKKAAEFGLKLMADATRTALTRMPLIPVK